MEDGGIKAPTGPALTIVSIAISLAVFMQVLDTSIANVAIPYISGGLAVSVNQGTWVITSFAVGNAIGLPLTGWLTKRFGKVKTMIVSIILFTILSWICGISLNFQMLVTSRFIQGFVGGPLIPLSQALMMLIFPKEKKNLALAIWSMVALIGPIAGPILGGWLTFDYSWPWIFYINVPVGIISSIIIWRILKNSEAESKSKDPIDWFGFLFLAIGVGFLQVMLDKGEQFDWFRSNAIRAFTVISVVSLILLIIWELTTEHPILDLSVFKSKRFSLGSSLTAISYMCFFGTFVITPLWLQNIMGYNATWAGLAIAPFGIIPLFTATLVAKLMDRYPSKYLILFCFLSFAGCLFWFTRFTTAVSFEYVAFSRFIFGLSICSYIAPLIAFSLIDLPKDKITNASGIFHFMRIFCGGAGTSLFVTMWDRRASHHHSNLADSLQPLDPNFLGLEKAIENLGFRGEAKLEAINTLMGQQAYMLATNDVFWFQAWIFVILAMIVITIRRRRPRKLENLLPGVH